MTIELYRDHKIVMSERPNFQEADIFSGSTYMIAYVYQSLSGNRTQDDLLDECYNVIDEHITWKEETSARRQLR